MEPNPMKQPVRVLYQGQEYVVKYRHDQTPCVLEGKYSILGINGTTVAFIGDYDDPVDGLMTTAYCSSKDTFNKRTGRIVSTVRLIKMLNDYEKNIIEGL